MLINAKEMDYKTLNEKLRFADEDRKLLWTAFYRICNVGTCRHN